MLVAFLHFNRWVQPGPYYVQDIVAEGTSVRLIFLDTVSFVTNLTLLADDAFPGYEALVSFKKLL